MSRLRQELHIALPLGIVGGAALGAREALLTLEANAFVQPGRYFFAYVSVPILCDLLMASLLFLAAALVVVALTRRGDHLAAYASLLGFGAALSAELPSVLAIRRLLQEVAGGPGLLGDAVLWTLAAGVAITAGGLLRFAVAGMGIDGRWRLLQAARGVLVISAILCWPVARFVLSEWRWTSPRPTSALALKARNVVLISIDTLRVDHLGSYGSRFGLTASIDRLASEGTVFRNAITSAPWTLPALASLFTGVHPHRHGAGLVTNTRDSLGRSSLPPHSWTLATALRAVGYRTQAFVTNPYLGLQYGLGSGFDGYDDLTIASEFFLAGANVTALQLVSWLRPDLVPTDRGAAVSSRAEAWLADHRNDGPFFLWLHYVDPHAPYGDPGYAPQKSFRGDSLLAPRSREALDFRMTSPDAARLRSGEIRPDRVQREAIRELYRTEVVRVDGAVGSVLNALDACALSGNTLVVLVSDHGEEFWEHGGVEHGHTVYDELVRVPLILRWPGHLPAGRSVEDVVRLVDIAPTVLDFLGLRVPDGLDGETLGPLLRGEPAPARTALVENLLFAEDRVAVRTATRKYILWSTGKEEVYDLTTDPGELRDVAAVASELGPMRDLYLANAPGEDSAEASPQAAPSRRAAALRSLGYVQ